jgi:pyruvate/2-oxoglutarate dehydrogenase complex dihydrolipoamide dehydrogenase (E3) component
MIASAHIAQLARRSGEYGVHTGEVKVNLKEVKARKDKIVTQFRKSIEKSFEEANNLTLLYGEAAFTGTKTLEVHLTHGGKKQITAEKIFIDCGTSPSVPALEGLQTVDRLNSTTIMDLEELPQHLIILGGGYIGLEFGQMFSRFGSKVSILEHGPQLLSREDPDIAASITDILQEEGIDIYCNTTVTRVSRHAAGGVELTTETNGKTKTLHGSHLLVAVGTTPNTKALNLTAAGVKTDEKGYIIVNKQLETSQPGVYALGDIKGGPEFTHISYDDYRIIEKNIIGDGGASTEGRMVPYTVFTEPQLGRIGLSEKEAREKGHSIRVASLPMTSVARAIETGQTQGVMKVIVNAQNDQILGAAILGKEGGEMMSMIQIAMMGKLPYTRLRDATFAHPTLAESLNSIFSKIE